MGMTSAMKGYGAAARFRAGAMGHQMKDRVLEKRLERAHQESERLRSENELLRDEINDAKTEHHQILNLLEERLPESEPEEGKKSHKGRWFLFLLAMGGGAYALLRRMRSTPDEWSGTTANDIASGSTA